MMSDRNAIPAILVAGTSSGSGKTTVARGILSYLMTEGYKVQSYKLGPDYIDSGHHALITGRPCINLDRYLLSVPEEDKKSPDHSQNQVLDEFHSTIGDAEVLVIEAVGGIFDDWHNDHNSPSEIAKLLGVPVLVVFDARASCQTAGIMASGMIVHDPDLQLAGFVFTKVNSERHFQSIVDGLNEEHQGMAHCYLPFRKELHTEERHLGLHLAEEIVATNQTAQFAEIFSEYLPMEKILSHRQVFPEVATDRRDTAPPRCRFAVARDRAFSFYYEYNLEAFRRAGAELVFFSPLEDSQLPKDIAGIYFGGGYPELHAEQLAKNVSLRNEIKQLAEDGMPIYAECGGLMYLGEELQQHETEQWYSGVGIFPYRTFFSPKLFLGYIDVETVSDCLLGAAGTKVRGHVFHRSDITLHDEVLQSSDIHHKTKKITQREGYTYKNVYASYAHLHFKSAPEIPIHMINTAVQWMA